SVVPTDDQLARWEAAFFDGTGGEAERDARQADLGFRNGTAPSFAPLEESYREAWHEHERLLVTERTERVRADYYVFALPVEQMAYYVNRSDALRRQDPRLANIIRLSEHVEWMAGIQFYLTVDDKITPGHIDCVDSEWHLTAISQAQFWPDVDLKELGSGPH